MKEEKISMKDSGRVPMFMNNTKYQTHIEINQGWLDQFKQKSEQVMITNNNFILNIFINKHNNCFKFKLL